ncbi:MAG: protein kinase [Pseudomonadota bacterium]
MSRGKSDGIQKAGGVQRWRWLPGLFVLSLVLAVAATGLLKPLEYLIYDLTLHTFAPPAGSDKVAVVELPQQWRAGEDLEKVFQYLGKAGAVAFMPDIGQQENHTALALLNRRLESLSQEQRETRDLLLSLRQQLNIRVRLAELFDAYDNVILPARYHNVSAGLPELDARRFGQVTAEGVPVLRHLPSVISPLFDKVLELHWPAKMLRESAAGVGLVANAGRGSSYPALLEYQGRARPGLLLEMLRLHYGGTQDLIPVFEPTGGIQIGPVTIPTDSAYRFRPYVDPQGGNPGGIRGYDYERIIEGAYSRDVFSGKSVFVGEAAEVYPLAVALDALVGRQVINVPGWSVWAQYGALLVVAAMVMFLLPRMRFFTAGLTTVLVLLLLVNAEFLLLLLTSQWLPMMLPALVLLIGFPLVALRGGLNRRVEVMALKLSDANRRLGRMLQVQGELDQALEMYRRCRIDAELLEQLYHLGLDFERKRQFAKAVTTFQSISTVSPDFRDVAERISRNRAMENRVALAGGGAATPGGTVIMDADGVQNPTLGHYEVVREIGRGAMGMVYLGKDPRIGRMVAIKTMAFSDEFEGEQLDEVKQRFYREAETAGRLNHPNIVHIYDIGEEQELAYIAMDYLQGEDLGHFVKPGHLLPIKDVLTIVLQVARALDYAHKKKVVHRDIKPANIIYDAQAKSAKVTDFGVACLTDSSKTKTGTVLGSPSYMSPEQVAGKKVDGRADIFSLGITLYQLSTGHLPFEADSLASLMFKIANQQHPKPSKFRKGIPVCVTRIINKCMQKDPTKRYQSGDELAAALERCNK